jgi:hypothetical protein
MCRENNNGFKESQLYTFSISEVSNVNRFMALTATRKFLMFSKYWMADCAGPSNV